MGGRYLKVLDAREQGVKQTASGKPPEWCKTLHVKNLPYDASEDEVSAGTAPHSKTHSIKRPIAF